MNIKYKGMAVTKNATNSTYFFITNTSVYVTLIGQLAYEKVPSIFLFLVC